MAQQRGRHKRASISARQKRPAVACGRYATERFVLFVARMGKNKDEERLHRRLDRLERRLPGWMARGFRRLREPSARSLRALVGLLLVAAGLLSFLPVLGLWMLPLGLLLLAQDLPPLRRPIRRALVLAELRWKRWRRRRAGR